MVARVLEPTSRPGWLRRCWDSVVGDLSEMMLIFAVIIAVMVPSCAIGYAVNGDDGLQAGFLVGCAILAVLAGVALVAGAVLLFQIVVAFWRGDRDLETVPTLRKLRRGSTPPSPPDR